MFFIGLRQWPLFLHRRSLHEPRSVMVWEDSEEVDLAVSWEVDLAVSWEADDLWETDLAVSWEVDLAVSWEVDLAVSWEVDLAVSWEVDLAVSWEADDLWETDLVVLWDPGLVGLDFVTTIVSLITIVLLTTIVSLITVSWTTIGSSFIIRTVSFSVLISFHLASLGGTPGTPLTMGITLLTMAITPLTMGTPTILPILAADRLSITSIGLIWPCQCNRSLPGAAITTGRLTG
jgi:hypothetical protein